MPADLADVAVETAVPVALARRSAAASWEARLQKLRLPGVRPAPTHVILDGIGHPIGGAPRFTIGATRHGTDLVLPEAFHGIDDCAVPLIRDGGRLWFVDGAAPRGDGGTHSPVAPRTAVEAGDRLTIRCGAATADVLFAHCATNGSHHHG